MKGVNAMLVLSRKQGERIRIGTDVRVTIVRVGPNSVRVGIEAPDDLNIVREELCHFTDDFPDFHVKSLAMPAAYPEH